MEYMKSWMYGSLRWKPGFREEVDKFIEAAKNHVMTLTQNKDSIICPYHDCKNHIVWRDVDIIRSHLIMRGFVEDYTVWIHHGETVVVNDDGDPKDDDETLETYPNIQQSLMHEWILSLAMNKVVMRVVGMVTTKVVPIMMVEHVLGILLIWRT